MQAMHNATVGIIGASGYSGIEATYLLAAHPHVTLRFVTSERWQGQELGDRLGLGGASARLAYAPQERAEALARECDAVLLATPAETSLELVTKLHGAGVRIIDLSGAFRLREA